MSYDPLAAFAAPIQAVYAAMERGPVEDDEPLHHEQMDHSCRACGGSGGGDESHLHCGSCRGTGIDPAAKRARDEARAETLAEQRAERRWKD